MVGTLTVQNLQGPASGANANKVIIPSGHTLDASAGFVPPAGSVVNVTQVTLDVGQVISSTSYTQLVNADITVTPKSASNKILIEGVVHVYFSDGQSSFWKAGPLAIYRDTTLLDDENTGQSDYGVAALAGGVYMMKNTLSTIDSPNTTSPVTYKLYVRQVNANNASIITNTYGIGHFRVTEIAQ